MTIFGLSSYSGGDIGLDFILLIDALNGDGVYWLLFEFDLVFPSKMSLYYLEVK